MLSHNALKKIIGLPIGFVLILAILGCSGLTYLIYINYTVMQRAKFTQAQQEEISLKHALEHKYKLYNNLAVYSQKTSDLKRLESQMKLVFPAAKEEVLLKLSQLATDTQINLSSFMAKEIDRSQQTSGHDNATIVADIFSITVVGSYAHLRVFIYWILQLAWVLDLNNLQFTRIDDEKVSLTFNLIIFYQPKSHHDMIAWVSAFNA